MSSGYPPPGAKITLTGTRKNVLRVEYASGGPQPTELDLDTVLGNVRGRFIWSRKGFSASAQNVRLSATGTFLYATLLLPATDEEKTTNTVRSLDSKVDLSEHIAIDDTGSLVVKDLRPPRTIVLCFDGTGNEFDETNTNVVKLFSCLKKNSPEDQMAYYQTGIGTYTPEGAYKPVTSLGQTVAEKADQAVAWYLREHVISGYRFLMQTYREGDRVCLFGFSRGAYTCRAFAGMLHAVGLLPLNNEEHIQFAYDLYSNGKSNDAVCAKFKRLFSEEVYIDFVGVWDTVASVGAVYSKTLPFVTSNDSILTFRHALSLDETRAKFQSLNWADNRAPEDRYAVDVEEVYFAGNHSDVGGGNVADVEYVPSEDEALDSHVPDLDRYKTKGNLANIPLRWMLNEALKCVPELLLKPEMLKRWEVPFTTDPVSRRIKIDVTSDTALGQEKIDAVAELHQASASWGILEVLPGAKTYQDPTSGDTKTAVLPNNWAGRTPMKCYTHDKYCLHRTVLYRHENWKETKKDWLFRETSTPYNPKATITLDADKSGGSRLQAGKTIPNDIRYVGSGGSSSKFL